MKPNFALVLSFDGIGLLHRAAGGWHMVGEVALDTADLAAELAVLRRTAVQLDNEGLRSKLVIPNEQIRYLTLPAPARGTDMAAHVAASLDGTTPYDVSDLRFDWVSVGDQLHIAAVALETLDEASGFAAEHGFAPVSYVALPPADTFPGEPFFGQTAQAAALIAPGDRLLRDTNAIRILGPADLPTAPELPAQEPDELPDEAQAETPDEAPHEEPGEALADTPKDTPEETLAETPSAQELPTAAITADAAIPGDDHLPPQDADEKAGPSAEAEPSATVTATTQQDTPPDDAPSRPVFSTRRERDDPPLTARKPIVAELPPLPASGDLADSPDIASSDAAPQGAHPDPVGPDPTLTPAPFISPPAPAPEETREDPAGLTGALLARLAGTAQPSADDQPAPKSRKKAARTKVKPTQSERQRLTIFGARAPESDASAIRGKPRLLGLVMTGVLLLFMAAVGAWSAMFGENGLGGLFGQSQPQIASQDQTPEATADTSLPTDPVAQGTRQDTADALPGAETATVPDDAASPIPLPTGDLPSDLAQLPQPSPQEAAKAALSSYAATGIWQIAPAQPEAPVSHSLDTLYLASIDSSLQNLDAVALPDISRALSDVRPEAQSNPAAPGTQFDLDDRGLVIATPEGAETPEGVIVYAGRPALTPPGMPTRFAQTPQADAQPEPDLAAVRPRLRPDTLIESNERATLGGLSRSELAGVRPRARPETLAAVALALRAADDAEADADEADAQDTGTDQAIATSLKPLARPRDLTTNTDSAGSSRQQVASAAALAPQRNAAPQIPSSASVAQQATVRGAINLRQVNLIGVYGQPSNRRALVRLSNGRYQKVQVGDRLDGGQVRAIGENELSYVKNNRAIVLTMPNG